MNKLLSENAIEESSPVKNHIELSPLLEQNDENGVATPASSEQIESAANDESIKIHSTSKAIAIDVNHDDKQIIVEVLATPIDTVDTVVTLSPSSSSISTPKINKPGQCDVSTGLEFVDYSMLGSENFVSSTEKSPVTLNQTYDINKTIDKSYETLLNDTMAIQLTSTVEASSSFQAAKRTSIGLIRLNCKADTVAESSNDVNGNASETYEILMVHKARDSVERTLDNIEEAPAYKAYPLYINNAIARKSTANDRCFPIAPSMILQRINLLQEYNRNLLMQTAVNLPVKPKAKKRANGIKEILATKSQWI